MAEDSNQFEEEYHFSDDMGSFEEAPEAVDNTETVVSTDNNLKRNLIIVFAVIVVILVAYKLVSTFYTSSSTATKTVKAPVVQQPKVQTFETPKPQVKPSYTPPPITKVVQAPASLSPEIKQKLSSLQITTQNTRSEVDGLNNNIQSLKSNLQQLNDKISALSQSVNNLTDEVARQQQMLKARQKPKKRRVVRKKYVKKTSYFVQALIPGRAWLKSSKGSTITVSQGTKIPGYGTVRFIDPHQGEVVTTSGMVFRFAPSDT